MFSLKNSCTHILLAFLCFFSPMRGIFLYCESDDAETKMPVAPNIFREFEWEFNADKTEIFITKYTGTSAKVQIPSTIEKLPVRSVSGFANNTKIVSVTIPDSVTHLRRAKNSLYLGTFTNCSALKSVTLSKNLVKIDEYAFANCSSIENIVMGEKLETLGSHIFADCKNLKKITLPQGIKKIPWAAFIRCSSLETVSNLTQITEIAYMAFQG